MKKVLLAVSLACGCGHVHAGSVYTVLDADNGGGLKHAFWLPPNNDSTAPGTHYLWDPTTTNTLTFDGATWETSTTAVLKGRIQQSDDLKPNAVLAGGTKFDVEVYFTAGVDLTTWTDDSGLDGDIKNEKNAASSDVDNWRFFDMDTDAILYELTHVDGTGPAAPAPLDIDLDLYNPGSMKLRFQVGIGASMKLPKDMLGASSWITYDNGKKGDINIELAFASSTPLIPAPAAALAAFPALGALVLRRTRRSS